VGRRRRGWRLAGLVAAVVVVLLVTDVGMLVHRLPTFQVRVPTSGGSQVFLLLASDSRQRLDGADRAKYADPVQAQGERADLVFLLRTGGGADPALLSVPRDLYVGALSHDPHRLGMTLQLGPQAMVDSMCRDLGVGVDHVVIADFRGLIDAVDAAGGVTVQTTGPMRDLGSGMSLSTGGSHHLDGAQALAWVRSRHTEVFRRGAWAPDPSADPTRSSHASQVLRQLAGASANPVTAQLMAWSAAPRLRRDATMSPLDLARLVWGLRQATSSGNVSTVPARATQTQVPVAFLNAQSRAALAPFLTSTCHQDTSAH
jgi:polyisoprenyl-teichoic acid--peptidoglycan teichoic acid transferase